MVKLTPGHEVKAVVGDAEDGRVAVVLDRGLVVEPDVVKVCKKLQILVHSLYSENSLFLFSLILCISF